MNEMSEIVSMKKGKKSLSMLAIKKHRPLHIKSIARHAEVLVIKGNTMSMKMGVSTFLTCLIPCQFNYIL